MLGERLVALVVGLLGIAAVWQASQFPSQSSGIGAGTLPELLGLALIILSILLLLGTRRSGPPAQKEEEQQTEPAQPGGKLRVTGAVLILALYLLLNQIVGFILATVIFALVFLGILFRVPWLRAGVWSVLLSVAVWALFRAFLHVPLPLGFFAGLF